MEFLMTFPWVSAIALSIPIVAIVMSGIEELYGMRLKELRHQENMERMRNGYPPLDEDAKGKRKKRAKTEDVVDMRGDAYQANNSQHN